MKTKILAAACLVLLAALGAVTYLWRVERAVRVKIDSSANVIAVQMHEQLYASYGLPFPPASAP